MTAPVSALKLNDVPVYDARKSGVIADGTTNNAAALQSALWMTVSQGLGICQLPAGTIKCNSAVVWPTASNLTLRGQGIGATVLEFSSSTTGGILYNVATRISRNWITDMTIHGGGAAALNGIDVSDWDRGGFERLRIYAWNNCLKLTSTGALGALHNVIDNCIITNGVVNCVWLTGAQGPHQTHIYAGEISIGATGLRVDTPTDQTLVRGTSFESNTTAIACAGVRGHYLDVRFEGNTADMAFAASSLYNVLETSFFAPTKHADLSTTFSNRVVPHGFAASATERKRLRYIPTDPMSVTLISLVPGTRLAVSHLFEVDNMFKAETLSYVPSVQNGNVDIALCDTAGAILASTGSTAVGVAGTKQDIALSAPYYLGPGRQYYIALMFDNATAGFYGFTATSAGFELGQNEVLAREKTITSFPFAAQNAVSGGSGTTKTLFARIG